MAIGVEIKAKIRDRRAGLDKAESREERMIINKIHPNLPEKMDKLFDFDYVSSLVPKENKMVPIPPHSLVRNSNLSSRT